MNLRFQSASVTHAGHVRELNEDAFFDGADQGVWCVADGMGGYEAGEVASAMVVKSSRRSRWTKGCKLVLKGAASVCQ